MHNWVWDVSHLPTAWDQQNDIRKESHLALHIFMLSNEMHEWLGPLQQRKSQLMNGTFPMVYHVRLWN